MTVRTVTAYVIACDAIGCDAYMQGPEGEDLLWQDAPDDGEVAAEIACSSWSGTRRGLHFCPEHNGDWT